MPLSTSPADELNDSLDWDLLVTSRLNAILCGDRPAIGFTLSMLRAHLALPLHEWSCAGGSPPPHPTNTSGTLIVTDLGDATVDQQHLLLDWLDAHDALRVITVSERPLFGLVERGMLLEQLYYRLNPMYCILSLECRSGSTSLDRSSAA
jgi:hypothetical protein